MSQANPALETYDQDLAEVYERCRRSFMGFYAALADEGCRVTREVSLTRISDEYGRFGVWGRNAAADRTGRGSLDDRLRNDPELRGIVFELLNDLDTYLIGGAYSRIILFGRPRN